MDSGTLSSPIPPLNLYKDFDTHNLHFPSACSTTTDLSQDFSPPKLKHRDSISLQFSSQTSTTDGESCNSQSLKLPKKAIFTIIKDTTNNKTVKTNNNVPLNKDFGNYNRKEKSLGELSKRLLIMFGRVEECIISLDTVTQQLGVERRRIYDIINILESLGVVFRKGKNSYQWRGLKSIYETIKKLQRENFSHIEEAMLQDSSDDEEDSDKPKLGSAKREKSLGLLSTGFIKLFLSWKGTISLEQAGRKLSSENIEENKIKTKIRRLYDIANVFSSLGLIKKTCLESKKPAYEWIGMQGLDAFIKRLNNSSDEKEIFQELPPLNKNKEKLSPVYEKKILEKQTSPLIQPLQSTNLFNTQDSAPLVNQDNINNLLCMLLSIYKNQPSAPKIHHEEEPSLTSLLFRPSYEQPKLFRQTSSPGAFNNKSGLGLITPSIRKSVSIIQRADSDCGQSTEKKKGTNMGFSLYDKGGEISNGKRKPIQGLGHLESTVKKLHSFSEFGGNNRTATKMLSFPNKENFFGIANSNME